MAQETHAELNQDLRDNVAEACRVYEGNVMLDRMVKAAGGWQLHGAARSALQVMATVNSRLQPALDEDDVSVSQESPEVEAIRLVDTI